MSMWANSMFAPGNLASVRQRIHVLAMQGIFGWVLGPITPWNDGTELKKKSELCGEIVISSSATSARRRSHMMNPNKVSDLVKGTGQTMGMSTRCVVMVAPQEQDVRVVLFDQRARRMERVETSIRSTLTP